MAALKRVQPLQPILRKHDLVAKFCQSGLEDESQGRVVINRKNVHRDIEWTGRFIRRPAVVANANLRPLPRFEALPLPPESRFRLRRIGSM